jgi:ornithine cyclodeaminase
VPIEAVATAKEAVVGADLICTATSSREPVLFRVDRARRTSTPSAPVSRQRGSSTRRRSSARASLDRRESALAGRAFPVPAEGAIGDDHIVGELGDVLAQRVAARRSGDEVTLFKSLGIGRGPGRRSSHPCAHARGEGLAVDFRRPSPAYP